VLTLGIVSTVGVVVGSAWWRWPRAASAGKAFAACEDTANHLLGAVLMGIGGVTAMGCTIGQGLSGLSTLALGSFVAWPAIMAGAVAGAALPDLAAGAFSMSAGAVLATADLERRFGGLRRLYGDLPAMPLRAARVSPWSASAAWARGRWRRWRAAASPNWC
jgi:hypothetical protein